MAQARTPASDNPVLSALKERMKDLYKYLPAAISGQEEPIHHVRVAARRLRVLLELGAAKPEGRKVRRAQRGLKQLARVAGLGRDLDVTMSLFARETAGQERDVRPILRALAAARRRAHRKMGEAFLDEHVPRLRADLKDILAKGIVDPETARIRLSIVREDQGGQLLGAVGRLGSLFDAEALHEVRSGARRLRYAAEVDVTLGGSSAESVAALRDLQTLLGDMHDAWMLSRWLEGWADDAHARGRDESAAGRRFCAQFAGMSRDLHARYLEWDPASKLRAAVTLLGRNASDPGESIHEITVHPPRHRLSARYTGHQRRRTASDGRGGAQVPRGRAGPRAARRHS